jgi:hypothetical protein
LIACSAISRPSYERLSVATIDRTTEFVVDGWPLTDAVAGE